MINLSSETYLLIGKGVTEHSIFLQCSQSWIIVFIESGEKNNKKIHLYLVSNIMTEILIMKVNSKQT